MSAAAAPKKRGRPKGSKNKPKAIQSKSPRVPEPIEDFNGVEACCGPNEGNSEWGDDPFLDKEWPNYDPLPAVKPSDPAYPAPSEEQAWAEENLKAIGLSEWAPHIHSPAGIVVEEAIQKLWKKLRRPPGLDEIQVETGMRWDALEDVITALVDEERVIRIGSVLIRALVPKKQPEPERVEVEGIEGDLDLEKELTQAPVDDGILICE